MSHFTVAVIHREEQSIEDLLAPYQNNMGNCPKEYLVFKDVLEEYIKNFNEETRQEFYCESSSSYGMAISYKNWCVIKDREIGYKDILDIEKAEPFQYFKKGSRYKCYCGGLNSGYPEKHIWILVDDVLETAHPDENVCFEGKMRVEVIDKPKDIPLKDYYNNDFEKYMEDWAGFTKNDEGKYGYWENPNAKWDWYQVGGRWGGLLKLTASAVVRLAEERKDCSNKVNSAKITDIDFRPEPEEIIKAERFWDLKINKFKPETKADEDMLKWDYYKDEYYLEKYKTKENYIKYQTSFNTYAVITPDGQWHSKGKMGWFGFSDEKPEESYNFGVGFKEKFIDNHDQNLYMTIVDCHI